MTEIVDLAARRQAKAGFPVPPPQPLLHRMKCKCDGITWRVECYGDPDKATSETVIFECGNCGDRSEAGAVWAQHALDADLPRQPSEATTEVTVARASIEMILRRLLREHGDVIALVALRKEGSSTTWGDVDLFETPEQHAWLYRQLHSAWEFICGKVRPVGKE